MGAKAVAKQWGHGWDLTFIGQNWKMGQKWRAESENVTNSPGAYSHQIDLWCSLAFLVCLIVIGGGNNHDDKEKSDYIIVKKRWSQCYN